MDIPEDDATLVPTPDETECIKQPASPPTIAASDDRQFLADVVAMYGPSTGRTASGRTKLNLATMSRILARRLSLVWDVVAHEFLLLQPDGTYIPVSIEFATNQVALMLQKIAVIHPDILGEVRPRRIATLVSAMRMAVAQVRPDPRQGLLEYIQTRLCVSRGHNLTTAEIDTDYQHHARQMKLPLFGQIQFHKQLARMVYEQFAIPRSNGVLRPAQGANRLTARKGFNNLKFK